jgi:hypothetical protein
MAGQMSGMIKEQRSAAKIIGDMFTQADELLGRKLEV